MSFVLSAQPINDKGQIGFKIPPPEARAGVLESEGETLQETFACMATLIERVGPTLDPSEFGDAEPAWDLSLTYPTGENGGG